MKTKGSPFESLALALGAVGWAWGLVLILATVLTLEHDDGTPDVVGQLGEAFAGTKPVDRELFGSVADNIHGRSVCDDMWFDEDTVLIRGIGPINGSNARAWLTFTVGSQVFVGRVTVDVWRGIAAGTGGLDSSSSFNVANNLHFVERVPPPPPGPPGWRVIRPGECVLGSTQPRDATGLIGRFLIDLPAERSIDVELMPEAGGEYIPKTKKLTLDGRDVPKAGGDNFTADWYRTQRDGRYELTVRRTNSPDGGHATGGRWPRYTVQVAWGATITGSCQPPSKYHRGCFEEVQP